MDRCSTRTGFVEILPGTWPEGVSAVLPSAPNTIFEGRCPQDGTRCTALIGISAVWPPQPDGFHSQVGVPSQAGEFAASFRRPPLPTLRSVYPHQPCLHCMSTPDRK